MEILYHGKIFTECLGLLSFVHLQAIGEVATRVAQLERIRAPGQPSPALSLKVEYTDSAENRKQGMGLLSQSVEALERFPPYPSLEPHIQLFQVFPSFLLVKFSNTKSSYTSLKPKKP
jgi:hypothetical protein